MHPENEHVISLIKGGTLGQVEFTRITIATTASEKLQNEIMKEALIFIRALHQEQIHSLYAASTPEQNTLLITIQFYNQALCHLFFDFSYHDKNSFIKHFEVCGSLGTYYYDSTQKSAFTADFLTTGPYLPHYQQSILDSIWLEEMIQKINYSILNNTLIQ